MTRIGSTGAQRSSGIADTRLLAPEQSEPADSDGEPRQRDLGQEFVPSARRRLLDSADEGRVDADGLGPVRVVGTRESTQSPYDPRARSGRRPHAVTAVAHSVAVLTPATALRTLIADGGFAATIALAISDDR